jgi:hypothetical protein
MRPAPTSTPVSTMFDPSVDFALTQLAAELSGSRFAAHEPTDDVM